jgi:hypothetical protein
VPGDLPEDVDDDFRGDLLVWVIELGWECDPKLSGMLDESRSHRLSEPAEPFAEGLFVEVPCRDRPVISKPPDLREPSLRRGVLTGYDR